MKNKQEKVWLDPNNLTDVMKITLGEIAEYGVASHLGSFAALERRGLARRLKKPGRYGLTPAGRRKLKEICK